MPIQEAAKNAKTPEQTEEEDQNHHVCPWWIGYLLVSPLRSWLEPAGRFIDPLVKPGMTVLDPGCGMGYFSLAAARRVGESGRVICVDMEPRMIRALERRARRKGLADRIQASVCDARDLGLQELQGQVDLALAIHMVHEVPRRRAFLAQISDTLASHGQLLVMEPRGHVPEEDFQRTLELAGEVGLRQVAAPFEPHRRSFAALLQR